MLSYNTYLNLVKVYLLIFYFWFIQPLGPSRLTVNSPTISINILFIPSLYTHYNNYTKYRLHNIIIR